MATTEREEPPERRGAASAGAAPPLDPLGDPLGDPATELPADPATELPAAFGKYFLTEKLATGGMAEIYLAKLIGPGGFEKQLVIKQIHPRLSGQRHFVDLFVAEAKTLVTLAHGNIVPVYELGVIDDTYFIAMEYIDGPTLYRLTETLRRRGIAMAPAVAAWITARILEGLDYAHRKGDGVIHRDLSPRNVMLSRDGEVKLVDFGIALTLGDPGDEPAGESAPTGSFPYMSPEQVRKQPLTVQTDLFSVGVLVWEMLVGHRLFARPDPDATLHAVVDGDIPRPSSARPEVPARLDDVVMRALERDLAARWTTASDMLAALQRYLYSLDDMPGPRDLAALVARCCPPETRRVPTHHDELTDPEITATVTRPRDERASAAPSAVSAAPDAAPDAAPSAAPDAAIDPPRPGPATAVIPRDRSGARGKRSGRARTETFATHVALEQMFERAASPSSVAGRTSAPAAPGSAAAAAMAAPASPGSAATTAMTAPAGAAPPPAATAAAAAPSASDASVSSVTDAEHMRSGKRVRADTPVRTRAARVDDSHAMPPLRDASAPGDRDRQATARAGGDDAIATAMPRRDDATASAGDARTAGAHSSATTKNSRHDDMAASAGNAQPPGSHGDAAASPAGARHRDDDASDSVEPSAPLSPARNTTASAWPPDGDAANASAGAPSSPADDATARARHAAAASDSPEGPAAPSATADDTARRQPPVPLPLPGRTAPSGALLLAAAIGALALGGAALYVFYQGRAAVLRSDAAPRRELGRRAADPTAIDGDPAAAANPASDDHTPTAASREPASARHDPPPAPSAIPTPGGGSGTAPQPRGAAPPFSDPPPGGAASPSPAATRPQPERPAAKRPETVSPRPTALARPARGNATALLTVGAIPWGTVLVDGKPVGRTPIDRLAVPAGRHVVTVTFGGDDPPRTQSYTIELGAGETKDVVADFTRP